MKNVEFQTNQTGALIKAVLRSRIIFMRLWLWAKIFMRLQLRLLPYIASQNSKVNIGSDILFYSDSV
jgi:hypothetical protein